MSLDKNIRYFSLEDMEFENFAARIPKEWREDFIRPITERIVAVYHGLIEAYLRYSGKK